MGATGYIGELRALVGQRPLIVVGAGVAVFDAHGRILLQHRTDDGTWGVIGGALEPGERLEDCAKRELREETGLEATHLRFHGMLSGPEWFHRYPNGDEIHNVIALFVAHEAQGEPAVMDGESHALRFFDLAEPPEMNRVNRQILDAIVKITAKTGTGR